MENDLNSAYRQAKEQVMETNVKSAYRRAIVELRKNHIAQMDEAIEAHTRLQIAESQAWEDSWRFEDDFHKAWFKAEGIFASIKTIENLLYSLED